MQLLVLPVQLHPGSLEDARDISDQYYILPSQLIPLQHMQLGGLPLKLSVYNLHGPA